MSRTRAEALVLVNWKGVFYERYLLDRHVTALEGANGAGKTTVMIAAYVVLLPDMSRLRFTNLGETGATGGDKGIWGRLGEPGRPAYAAIEFALTGARRLIAGVHLERKGEPSVEPTPFIVEGLREDVRLQDLMLVAQGDSEAIPELTELRENAARLGGRLTVFNSARDYFAYLFDQGVTPLRLGTEEERTKLNDMLRTSMTGGISRVLTSELRSFLLKEESGLAGTLQRMKANLDACRRTRIEVQESQRLEREIGGVFEAGQRMFEAAFLSTRVRAEELARRLEGTESQRNSARVAFQDAHVIFDRVREELSSAEMQRADDEAALHTAQEWRTRVLAAFSAAEEVDRRRADLDAAEKDEQASAAERAAAAETRDAKHAELRRAQDDYKRGAGGLADLKVGLDELHRRAGAHRQVVRRRTEAETILGLPELPTAKLASMLTTCHTRLAEVDRERRDGSQRLVDASAHRKEHGEASSALRTLLGAEFDLEAAYSVALDQLRRLRDARALADRGPAIERDLDLARKLAVRQRQARDRAQNLGVVPGDGVAAETIRRLLDEAESERTRLDDAERAARATHAEIERVLKEMHLRRRDLADREPEWRDLANRASRLVEATAIPLLDRAGLDRARAILGERLDAAREQERLSTRVVEELYAESRELLSSGGPFDPELLRLRDQLGADLVATRFEDAGLDEAAVIEARLGPLTQALVVDDPRAVARAIETRAGSLESVWLVAGDRDGAALVDRDASSPPGSRDVLVDDGSALRVTRVPDRPRLGRKAREQRASELREEAASREGKLEEERLQRRVLERLVEDGEALLAGQVVWLAGDPAPELVDLRRRIVESEAQAELQRSTAARHADASRALRPRIDGLRELLPDGHLIDPPDQAEQAEALAAALHASVAAQAEVARCSEAGRVVEDRLDALRRSPLSDSDVAALRQHVENLRQERDRLDDAIEAIQFVGQNVEALGWSDATEKLREEEALVPALQDQLRRAEVARDLAETATRLADAAYERSTSEWQTADGRRRATFEQLTASEARLMEIGIAAPTANDVQAAEREATRLEAALRALSQQIAELATESGRRETECKQADERLRELEERVASERRDAEPAIERWDRLRELAGRHDLVASVPSTDKGDLSVIRGQVNLVQEALKQKATLVERLRLAQGGKDLLAAVDRGSDGSELSFGETHLDLWLSVRDWLRRRLPAQVAEVDDPQEALRRLRDQLASLDERLTRQESDLRGASEDVARGIDVQIRKARGQVNRLNKNLDGIHFGSIRGIRVRIQPVERMEQVLRALREGAAQALLFQENLPIEEALDEIFRRYGGGRAGSQRLLDYREYVHLQVEIRRNSGTDWETANPTRLSTGEAIGVGAALMMVVLTEWEHDANLLRAKKSFGSLRFLFLDEANRLSHDNLGVLFDLCQNLDLQLLIAAPEVARAEGNTTYRLVRQVTADGREEVLVSGRRARMGA